MGSPATPSSDDEGWLVDTEKSAGSTQPGLPPGASASRAFFGLPSISEDGDSLASPRHGFSRALLLLQHEHEREIYAVQARCDLELQALRAELVTKTGSGGMNDVPVFGIDKRQYRSTSNSASSSIQSPAPSEAPSFAADARVGVLRAEASSDYGHLQKDLSHQFQATADHALARRLPHYKLDSQHQYKSVVEANEMLWDLAVAQGRRDLAKHAETTPTKIGVAQAVHRLVYSSWFAAGCCFLIVLNCVLMGIGADVAARRQDPDATPQWCQIASRIFSIWFVIELALRFVADGRRCRISQEFGWNVMDLLLVMIDVVEIIIEASIGLGKMFDVSVIRVLRALRILKTGRALRMVTFCRELRILLACVLKSLAPLLWVFVLLALLIFVFSLFLVQITTGHLCDTEGELLPEKQALHREALVEMFGTMTDALHTLFQAVTGGIDWGTVNAALIDIHWINGVIFAFYIFLFVFGASNIVTSIFLEQALRSMRLDQAELLQMRVEGADSAYSLLRSRLKEADATGSGFLNILKLKALLEDKMVSAYLSMIGVEVHEAWGLCHLLGHEATSVSVDEFLAGCLRLHGEVRSIDVATVMHENSRAAALLSQVVGTNLGVLENVREALSSLQASRSEGRSDGNEPVDFQSPRSPCSPRPDEVFSPPMAYSPRSNAPKSEAPESDTPKFGESLGTNLLSVPTDMRMRPWAGDVPTATCGVPPAQHQ